MKKFLLCVVFGFLFCGCFAILEPAQTKHFKDIKAYDYAYLNATQTLNSGVGAGAYGYYGGSYSVSKSINPADMIAGILMKKGFIIVNDTTSHTAKHSSSITDKVAKEMLSADLAATLWKCLSKSLTHRQKSLFIYARQKGKAQQKLMI